MRARAAAWVVVAIVAGAPVVPAGAGSSCANEVEFRNEWSAVPIPKTPDPVAVAQADDDPCVMVATDAHSHVYRSPDGGLHWSAPHIVEGSVVRPVMASLAQGRVALVRTDGGLLVSADAGQTFAPATGLDGVHVLDLRSDPTERARVYLTGRLGGLPTPALPPAAPAPPSVGTSIWVSTDFGSSFSPLPASAAFAAAHVAVDEDDPKLVWADSASAGIWFSDDRGQTFVSKDTAVVLDVHTANLEGGGTVVVAPTTNGGFRRSVDGGDTWTTRLGNLDISELVFETGHPAAFMLVTTSGIQRSADHGVTANPANDGLPAGCDARGLTADGSAPSTFLVTCTGNGRAYRYRGDGSDWGWIDDGTDGNGFGVAPRLPHHAMDELAEIELPNDQGGQSATIAFDGQLLYYADDEGVVHAVDAKTGSKQPDLKVDLRTAVRGLTYDSLRHLLYALDEKSVMYRIDPRTGQTTRLFADRINLGGTDRYTSYSFDTAIDRFRAVYDGGGTLYEVDMHGKIVKQCDIPTALLYQRDDGGVPGFDDGATSGPSAVVASGDGGVYVQNEDDQTVLRLSRSCQPLAVFTHRQFSEAPKENDQIACDTNTFDVPAIWIRDSEAHSAFAYEVPGGYCALATKLRVTTSPVVANDSQAPVCAELRLRGKDIPVAGQDLHLYVGRHEVGVGRTNPAGVACVEYHPADYPEYGSPPPPPKAGQQPIDTRATEQVVANYLGTIAYRPARGTGQAVVTTFVGPLLPLPRPPAPALPEPAIVAAPPPPLPVAPPQPPPPASQPQPLAQGHPGAQPGALGQPGAAAERQEDVEVADQSADVREFRARQPEPSPGLPMAVVGFAFAMALLEQRRRRSRVREVGA